ncbi:MAG: flagellin lysine-N-methylase [Clostridia bacterium]|nr:flagellin lysine-N-methylase [Clostridia bacterium]
MKEAVPNYYHKFKCIADQCRHNCCIGWEIEIDEETMEFYQSLDTPLGERIRKSVEGETPHFILGAGERCPFLKENGLCEIICEQGEDALCDICTLHPRFRNFYDSFWETGLGLCCQEAARVILTETEPFSVPLPGDVTCLEEEQIFFAKRQRIFSVLQEREKSVKERLSGLAEEYGISFGFSLEELRQQYLTLERLDDAWTKELEGLQGFAFDEGIFQEPEFQLPMEQLAVYFIFRHLSGASWDGNYAERVGFALMSCYLIGALWDKHRQETGNIRIETMADLARMYSAEVEYSQENMEALMLG